ncbi:ThiF family adenylyltransferase [Paraglaciecola sp. 20A4]|uniref:ThiF family adenylyltransferase n=1 Tax=Paraglaciecola sp. 20A4 TaxID=2687288 RepID=UPI0014083DDC|nr:ThiF family adenylyltransferase [Paraglaciecola sp. 20A4]
MSIFSAGEWQQYQRHVQLHEVGVIGQQRLKNARVLIVGAGGLGCPVAQYLGAAGVGHITLIDNDLIAQSNLHRQILFGYNDIGQAKAQVTAKRLMANNPFIEVQAIVTYLNPLNVEELVTSADIVLDCSDNFATRLLINQACVHFKTPWIYASVLGLNGQVALFTAETACFHCVFPEISPDIPDCNGAGVLSTVPGLLGIVQANTCLHFLLGTVEAYQGKLQLYDGARNYFRAIALAKNEECACCGITTKHTHGQRLLNRPTGTAVPDAHTKIDTMALSKNSASQKRVCETNLQSDTLTPEVFVQRLSQTNNLLLIDVRSRLEHQGFNIGGQCMGDSGDFIDAVRKSFPDVIRPIFLYCQSGVRSSKAGENLRSLGYLRVYDLKGGLAELLTHEHLRENLL